MGLFLNFKNKTHFNISRRSYINLRWFSWGSFILVELEFGEVGFCGGRKTGEPGEKPSEQDENQEQTQPTYDTGPKPSLWTGSQRGQKNIRRAKRVGVRASWLRERSERDALPPHQTAFGSSRSP